MKCLRLFALSAASLIGVSMTSAQASEFRHHGVVCRPPVVACSPAPVSCPTVICPPVVRQTYFRPAVSCRPRFNYRHGCR
jgi:hypothetical protein